MWEAARSQEMVRTAPLLPPKEGRERIIHSVPLLAQGPAVPTLSKKEQIPFPPSFQASGLTVCDALPPHSRPRPILPAAKRVRLGDAGPPHAPLASPYRDSGSSARMSQNAGPSVPSSLTPIRCTTAGTSIVPLEPLARRLEAWLALPKRLLGSRAQFDSATRFSSPGDLPSSAAFSRLRWQLETLLSCARRLLSSWQGCNRAGPSSRDESGVLQPLFHRTQERRWSSANPGLRLLNRALHRLPFKMLTHRRMIKCIQPRDWFAAIDLKDAYFHVSIHPRHRPFLRFALEGRAWQYRVLPFGLSLSPRVFTKVAEGALAPLWEVGIRILNYLEHGPCARTVVRSQGPGASAPQLVGASGQLGKEQALPCAENLFSWCGVRLGEYDGAPHGRARPISAELPEFLQRQDCGSAETVSEAPGAYGIRSCSHVARIASYETISALVALPSPEVGMAPRCTSGEHHTGVSPLLQPLDGPCLSTGRGALRTSVSACCCHNRCLQHGLGRYMQRAGSLGALDGASTALAHQLPRAAGSASSLAAVSATAVRQACVGPYGQHCGCVVHQPDGVYTITPHVTARPPSPPLESQAAQITAHCPHFGGAQSCGRCALMTAHFPGEWRLHPETIRLIWSRFGGSSGRPVCFPRVLPLPAVFLPDRGHPRHGRTGTQLASGSMQVCISPSEPARTDTVQGQGGRGAGPAGHAVLAHPDLVSRTHSPRNSPSLAHSSEEGSPFSGARHHLAPASRPVEPPCVAPGRDAADLSGLPQAVLETITQARAPSTRQAYALKWSLFANWCSSRREDPRRCTIGVVISFLQERLERRLSPSTLEV